MSKAVKQSILILVLLLVVSIAVALMTLLEKQKLQTKNKSLNDEIADYQSQQAMLTAESAKLKEKVQTFTDQLASREKEKSKFQDQYKDIKGKYDQLDEQVKMITKERDDWKDRSTTVSSERDRLMRELQTRPEKVVEKIVYKDRLADQAATSVASGSVSVGTQTQKSLQSQSNSGVVERAEEDSAKQQADESHWAEVFKQKAALEVEVDKSKKALDESALQIVELKKQAADMQIVIDKLNVERDEIIRKIKYGEDLADTLSIELARAKNDQKFTAERAEKVSAENAKLQMQVKTLTQTKFSLEKTISRLTDDKESIQKKLIESESVIQSRIDDIWKIKQNIDQRIQTMPTGNENQVELAPIVINANGNVTTEVPADNNAPAQRTADQAHIVSINSDNNFVIIDIGEKDGVKMGDSFRVYRGSKEIGRLEVIQLRRDISAADIKKSFTQLQVGDIVR